MLDCPKECAVVVEVAVVGVGGSDGFRRSAAADCELAVRACNDGFSFFFFLRNPRVGMQGRWKGVEKGEPWSLAASDPFVRFEYRRTGQLRNG